jgi:DNA-directed RNA polymerase subunit M/transcription elongation factor TFIIS
MGIMMIDQCPKCLTELTADMATHSAGHVVYSFNCRKCQAKYSIDLITDRKHRANGVIYNDDMKHDRYSCKTDDNQREIVEALRKAGCSVTPTHMVGSGFPDIVVGYNGVNYLIEIKASKKDLNLTESMWHSGWRGQSYIARTAEEALGIVGIWTLHEEQ